MKTGMIAMVLLGWAAQVGAVRLSIDSAAEVLILPWFQVGDGHQTVFEVRNRDPVHGKAVRFVVKDPVNGRPTLALNVYLKPDDSWSGALYDPAGLDTATAVAYLAPWQDESCTIPPSRSVTAPGLALSADAFSENFSGLEVGGRRSFGFVEFYEMGTIPADLAADCEAIEARWAFLGLWATALTLADADVTAPTGTLEAYGAVINNRQGISFQFEALPLDDFRDLPLHNHPRDARHPNLADVRPSESRVLETVRFGNRTLLSERVSTWSAFPVQAVDAVLMTVSARGDYTRDKNLSAGARTILAMPTRAYHTDVEEYYLPVHAVREMAPFKVSTPPLPNETLGDNRFAAKSVNRRGTEFTLSPFSNARNCDLANSVVTQVFMTDIIGFDYTCEYYRSEFRVGNSAREGEVVFQFDGEIRSDEGHVYRGLPIYGVLMQTLRNEQVPLPGNFVGIANHGWARALKSTRSVSGDSN